MHRPSWRELIAVVVLLLVLCSALVAGTNLLKADKIAVGPTNQSTGRINIASSTASTGGIDFGSDASIFRDSAARLKVAAGMYVQDDVILGHASSHTTTIAGNTTVGGTLGVTGASTLTGATTVTGALTANGATTLGDANTDTITCTGRLILRTVASDPLDGTAGNRPAGSVGEIAIYSSRIYLCTNAATPTWIVVGPPTG